MIKELFCTAALIVAPCLAFAANPSADLSVKVVPKGSTSAQCSSPPAEAAQAGLTTMALCNDFTQPIPNTAGTGLPSNTSGQCFGDQGCWLGCASPSGGESDNFPHVWYGAERDFYFSTPCNETGAGVQQVTDPVNGNLALDIAFSVADSQSGPILNTLTTVSPNIPNGQDPATYPDITDFPMGTYIEFTARDNTADFNTGNLQTQMIVGMETWAAAQWDGFACSTCVLERDVMENWGDYADQGPFHDWYAGGVSNGIWAGTFPEGVYHTFGLLTTSDGSSDIKVCAYRDHALLGCTSPPGAIAACGSTADNGGSYCQRSVPSIWSGKWSATGTAPFQLDSYFKSIQVWSCVDWRRGSTGPNPNCFGGAGLINGNDGSQFYKVTAQ